MQRRIFLFSFILLFGLKGWGQTADCIAHSDLKEISENFSQLKQFVGNQTEYCAGDFSEDWFRIARSLEVLKNIQPDEPAVNQDDALTYKAISEKDWWAYFTQRANTFSIENNCQPNVVAYVMPFFGQGRIHLCRLFFDQTVSDQASTMMHEVRHFDGHRHVTCTQGNEKGNGGACDNEITSRGSYAISVQTLVGLARSPETQQTERPILEAQAVYMAFNKFNRVPEVKLNNSIILSADDSSVYTWTVDGDLNKIANLPHPSSVFNSANNLTIYPMDTDVPAYRQDNELLATLENPGLYAKHYNSETPQERAAYKSISYFATGGLLKDNTLLTLCNRSTNKLAPTNLDSHGQFDTIISLSLDELDQKRESILLASNGDMYRFECQSSSSDNVRFEKLQETMNIPAGKQVVDSFGYNGDQYALLDSGELALVNFRDKVLTLSLLSFPSLNQNWLSATPISIPEVF